MAKRNIVRLSQDERHALEGMVNQGRVSAQRRRHAAILLRVDEGKYGPAMTDTETADQMELSTRCIESVRRRCVHEGLEKALQRKKRSRERTASLDGEGEAQLISLACSEAPEGRVRWTLRLLSEKLVELDIVDTISYETVRQVLKKHHKTLAEEDVVYTRSG